MAEPEHTDRVEPKEEEEEQEEEEEEEEEEEGKKYTPRSSLLMCSNRPQRTFKWNESIIQSADADADAADAAAPHFLFFFSSFFKLQFIFFFQFYSRDV